MQNESYQHPYRRHSELGATERLVPAIVLISIGGIFLLSNLHIVYFREWLRYWPAILVAVGIVKLVDSQETGGRVGGGILVGARRHTARDGNSATSTSGSGTSGRWS